MLDTKRVAKMKKTYKKLDVFSYKSNFRIIQNKVITMNTVDIGTAEARSRRPQQNNKYFDSFPSKCRSR